MTYEERIKQNEFVSNIAYYVIIGVISLFSLCFLPFIGSTLKGGFLPPKSGLEWAIWIGTKIIVATINVLIFYCFVQQAKINVKDDPNYVEALKRLSLIENKKGIIPRSPKQYNKKQYTVKGITIVISTIASTIVISEAILSFELITFLTYLFVIVLGVVFGYISMRQNETYWVSEFPQYVKYMEEKENYDNN